MGLWRLNKFSGLVVLFFSFFFSFFIYGVSSMSAPGCNMVVSSFYRFDSLSFYLSLLSLVLAVSLFYFKNWIGGDFVFLVLMVSISFSLMCYVCVNAFWFWVFYEFSILPLLFLLVRDSPYSERYVAFWYFCGYIVFSSLPMFMCLLWFSIKFGSFSICYWMVNDSFDCGLLVVLGILFITKVPLPPFHVWLPLVHAEASSAVSICLSGYIMKLGVVGVYRFCSSVFPFIFSIEYAGLVLIVSLLFFLCSSCELDGKRWLAFMSLGHIALVPLAFCSLDFGDVDLVFLFCLGHGLSAALGFMILWFLYEMFGTRNWFILKGGLSSGLFFRCIYVLCLCSIASFPLSVGFFCEVSFMGSAGSVSSVLVFLFFVYLFVGALIPFFLLGTLLTRHYSFFQFFKGCGGCVGGLVLLSFWCSFLFLLV